MGTRHPPIPGQRMRPQWAISALTSVPVSMAAGGVHDETGRLVDHDQIVHSSWTIARWVDRLNPPVLPARGGGTARV